MAGGAPCLLKRSIAAHVQPRVVGEQLAVVVADEEDEVTPLGRARATYDALQPVATAVE